MMPTYNVVTQQDIYKLLKINHCVGTICSSIFEYMNGGVKKISKLSSKDIQPGMEIVVPAKNLKKKLSTAEIVTIGSSAVSIATMVVSIVNLLR